MTLPYLAGHFIYNAWAAPNQDNQSMIRPVRVTPFGGARNHIKVFREDYNLPTKKERYHAYVLGQVSEHILNLPFYEWPDKSAWTNMADYVKKTLIWFQFYTVDGLTIPLSHIYFTVTIEKNLVFVIKEDTQIEWDMNSEDITFRTYKNVMYTLPNRNKPAEKIDIFYLKVLRQSQKSALNDFYRKYARAPGKVFTYVNGFFVKDPITYPIMEKDVVEVVYDSTIVKSIELKINQIPTFQSLKDGIRKYLFTHDKSYKQNLFEYFDDCEFYLSIYPTKTPSLFKGVHLHRNDISNIRQVTNCDFSISSNLVKEMMLEHDFLDQQQGQVVFQVFYRKQYAIKKLPYVHNRLHELNKLPYKNRVAAMIGVRSNIDEWRADVLENSLLMEMISKDKPLCDLETAQNIYGYNGATWYTAKSVHPYKDFVDDGVGGKYVNVPYSFRPASTIFEYDEKGKLIGWYRLGDYRQYPVKNQNCRYVEFIAGVGTRQPHHYYGDGTESFVIPAADAEYRVFACDENLIAHQENDMTTWEDVTEKVVFRITEDKINGEFKIHTEEKFASGSATPMYETSNKKMVYRTDRDFLCREINVNISRDNLNFTLMQFYWDYDTDSLKEQAVKIPYGYLDVFLNGHALIENVDYFVDFPKVHIINKGCINQNSRTQKILYRMYAFPDTIRKDNADFLTGILNNNRQVGYVNNSMLSRNAVWNILEDKNLLIKVGNGIIAKEDLGFSEDGSVIPNTRTAELEGKPYEIVDVISGKVDSYPKDAYQFKKEAEILDKKISDYMTQFFPDKKFNSNPPIQGLYKIFSPLISRLIYDLKQNQITTRHFPNLETRYLDTEVIEFIESRYKDFFKIEPYFKLDEISLKHVTIHPSYKTSITTIKYHQMRFLKAVVRIYYNDYIELSHFVRIEDEG